MIDDGNNNNNGRGWDVKQSETDRQTFTESIWNRHGRGSQNIGQIFDKILQFQEDIN